MLRHRWSKKLWRLLFAAALLTSACKHKEQTKVDPKIPEVSYTAESALVTEGLSSQPAFSPQGDKLLFVSARRPGHAQAQVYEKDLQTGVETRITFQNGDVTHPTYHPKEDFILYSSSTDELKENPPLLRPATINSLLPTPYQEPAEIYLHSRKGLEITRLTDTPGFDGEARFSHDGKTIYFTRARGSKLESVSMNRASHAVKSQAKLGTNPAEFTSASDGKWQAWIDWDDSFGVAKLKIQKGKSVPVEITPDLVVPKADVEFSFDAKWLFWSQYNSESGTWQLWTYQLDTSCARKLSDNKDGDRRHPALSPDGQRLVYTASTRPANPPPADSVRPANVVINEVRRTPIVQSRIMQVGFTPPSGPCAGAP